MSKNTNNNSGKNNAGKTNNNNNNKNSKQTSSAKQNKNRRQIQGSRKKNNYEALSSYPKQGFVLSNAAGLYARALSDPFQSEACAVPSSPALMTSCRKVWSRGKVDTTTVGLNSGFIVASPENGAMSDLPTVAINNATWTGGAINTSAGTTSTFPSNAEYPIASFGQGKIQTRLVAYGLRIKNTTSLQFRGGSVVGLAEPSHADLNGFTLNDFNSYSEAANFSKAEDWVELLWRPVDTDDYDFYYTITNGYTMGFYITAPNSASQQTYDWEIFGLYEYQGKNVTGKTHSVADDVGSNAVANTMVAAAKLHQPHMRDERIAETTHQAANHMLKHKMTPHHPANNNSSESSGLFSSVLNLAPSAFNLLGALL